jgi:hypothetical protein
VLLVRVALGRGIAGQLELAPLAPIGRRAGRSRAGSTATDPTSTRSARSVDLTARERTVERLAQIGGQLVVTHPSPRTLELANTG